MLTNGKIASDDSIAEMKALVTEGDIKLGDERAKFLGKIGRPTTLNDDDLLEAIAATDDDDTNLFVENVLTIEDRNKRSEQAR